MNSKHQNRRLTPAGFTVEKLEKLRPERNEIERNTLALTQGDDTATDHQELQRDVVAAQRNFEAISQFSATVISGLKDRVCKLFRDLRAFRADRGLDQDALVKPKEEALFLILPAGLAEGIGAGVLMSVDGKMGHVQALAYGLSFATINIAIGVFCGFYCVRYAFRSASSRPLPREHIERQVAYTGLWICLFAIALLLFSAARTRATGSHEGIFDFSQVSIFATMSDAYSIALVFLGLLGSCLAIIEGAIGFSDFEPGYSALRRQAEEETQFEALEALEDAVEDIFFDYDEQYESLKARRDEIRGRVQQTEAASAALADRARSFNSRVLADLEGCHLYLQEFASIEGESPESFRRGLDFSAFEDLLIPIEALQERLLAIKGNPLPPLLLCDLAPARDQAISDVRRSYTEFQEAATKAARNTFATTFTNHKGVTYETS